MNENRNEKRENFEADINGATARVQKPPADLFIGQMICFLCNVQTIGLPSVSSGWRCLDIEGNRYFICKKCAPSVVASEGTWKSFYVKVIRKIYEKDFNCPMKDVTIYIDAKELGTQTNERTPSGTQFVTGVSDTVTGDLDALLKDIYEKCLPTIYAAAELVPQSGGKTEFTASGDCDVVELDYTISLKIDFTSFGGVRLEHLPDKEKAKAKTFLPLYLTLERLVAQTIALTFAEMDRQNEIGMRQAFRAEADQLTFIEGFLYKINLAYEYAFKPEAGLVPLPPRPVNPNLN